MPLLAAHFTISFFQFPDNIMADVASKQQTTALFLSTTVTRTRTHTELTKLMGNLCCAREHSVQFFVPFFKTQTAQLNLWCMGPCRVHGALKGVFYKFLSTVSGCRSAGTL